MKAVFLGTNGWYSTETGDTICIFVETKEYNLVFDAGNGIHKLSGFVDNKKPVILFLSHFHLDHTSGIHILGKFKFPMGLTIAGPKGTRDIFSKFFVPPITADIKSLPFETKIIELPEEENEIDFKVQALQLEHAGLCLGFRIEIEDKVFAYVSDTGFCNNAVSLAKDANLLVTECALLAGESQPDWPHLNPLQAAEIAKQSGAKQLILTHFEAAKYKTLKQREKAANLAKQKFKNTHASFDLMSVEF